MRSAFAMDRVVGILTRIRAVLGIAGGVLTLLFMVLFLAGMDPLSGLRRNTSGSSQAQIAGRPALTPQERAERRKEATDRLRARLLEPVRLATTVFFCLAITGVSMLEYRAGGRIGRGEQRGFVLGIGVELVSALFGLYMILLNPWSGVGLAFAMLIFLYCIARTSGWGPKPVRDPIVPGPAAS